MVLLDFFGWSNELSEWAKSKNYLVLIFEPSTLISPTNSFTVVDSFENLTVSVRSRAAPSRKQICNFHVSNARRIAYGRFYRKTCTLDTSIIYV